MGNILVKADVDYVGGHLRTGHYELEIDKETWNALTKEEKLDELSDGELIVDDWELEDHGDILPSTITVEDVPEKFEMVTIRKSEYESLLFTAAQMDALDAAGVDNWEGYGEVEWPREDDYLTES